MAAASSPEWRERAAPTQPRTIIHAISHDAAWHNKMVTVDVRRVEADTRPAAPARSGACSGAVTVEYRQGGQLPTRDFEPAEVCKS